MPEKTLSDRRTNFDDTTIRVCDKCSAKMTLLSELPAFYDHAAAKIFRCYACNSVARAAIDIAPRRNNINRDGSTVGCTPRAV
jgi:hypothetical protein